MKYHNTFNHCHDIAGIYGICRATNIIKVALSPNKNPWVPSIWMLLLEHVTLIIWS